MDKKPINGASGFSKKLTLLRGKILHEYAYKSKVRMHILIGSLIRVRTHIILTMNSHILTLGSNLWKRLSPGTYERVVADI
jgi:hypothetical protein